MESVAGQLRLFEMLHILKETLEKHLSWTDSHRIRSSSN